MEFEKLYLENQEAVKKALKAMWCSDPHTATQRAYMDQIAGLIDKELFTSDDYMPLVQCMDRYESIDGNDLQAANNLVGGLWTKDFLPYKHQKESWRQLANNNSIVVTTGTGSGKTECFMLPLVNDLKRQPASSTIKAIFLYPLNALMEDQKARLQEILAGTNLRFAVYNGNLPNDDGASAATAKLKAQLKRQVAQEKKLYRNIVPTREELWASPPDIILTNPTMLEYMLLRKKDQHLFTPGSLRWIVIDEAHTFSGAGAAELAMLIRRVLDAFSTNANAIRFATSSATIGNATSEAEKNAAIVRFIQDITGSRKVVAIDGKRVSYHQPSDSEELKRCRSLLSINDYVRLDKLFPQAGETIGQKLARLDALCSQANPLKAKLHFFYRVPSNGLRVRLTEMTGNALKVYSSSPTESTGAPYLELMRCEHCGEFVALGESIQGKAGKYRATSSSGNDIFDFDGSNDSGPKLVFAYTDKTIDQKENKGNITVDISDDSFHNVPAGGGSGWRVLMNVQKCCPCCGGQLIGMPQEDDNETSDTDEKLENVRQFRVSGNYISRVLAPSILPNLMEDESPDAPHKGQQYISFVDSRQGAAKSTMQQNLEEERMWIYSRIYHELCRRAQSVDPSILERRARYKQKGYDQEDIDELAPLPANHLEWSEVFDLLKRDPVAERLAFQFVNKRELSEEYDTDNQRVDPVYKSKYIYSSMIEQLGKRPKKAAAPETMGLFTSHFPKLDRVSSLPDAVATFNEKFSLGISLDDWKALLKMFLDYYVRSNESLYLKNGRGDDHLDIKNCCRRFGTTKPPRRPVHKESFVISDDKKGRYVSTVVLLATLIDPDSENINDTIYNHRGDLNPVLEAFWNDLTSTTGLLQHSEFFDEKINDWDFDRDRDENKAMQYRLNATDIAFKLYDSAWLCDSRFAGEMNPAPRPVDTLFMGYAPYIIGNKAQRPISSQETWSPYPFIEGMDNGRPISGGEVLAWAKENRGLLCEAHLWGEDGAFSNVLENIHLYPDIFIQAEHTAQVDKMIAKQSQELFKARQINILACSTTMEMGVDLGNLEMVVMTSVPPHPSNYKQRAGRSGRNDNPRSACITLCTSDSVGLRTLLNPLENLINRPMQTPFVDLKSPQVIQRHANAYLFRLSGIFSQNARGNANNLDQELIEFFTPFAFGTNQYGNIQYDIIVDPSNNQMKYPCDLLGDVTRTKFYDFKDFLNNCADDDDNHIDAILRDTIFDSCASLVIQNCKDDIERCYEEILARADELSVAYDDAKNKALASTQNQVNGNNVQTPYGRYLRHKYSELLSKNLIEYFSTNRFTPNANMPVNVVEFDINNGKYDKYDRYRSNNPSYPLQQAISQYSPGNTVVLENRTVIVRGLLYTGMFKSNVTFKKIYSDGVNTVVGEERKNTLQTLCPWPVNGLDELTMIEPYAFIPDINEEHSRVVEDAPYTQVSAQLIGAGDWADLSKNSSLISVRNNRDCGEASILYYNEGIGFGYCFCSNCGKTIMEKAPGRGLRNLPLDMNNQTRDVNGTPEHFHYMINRKRLGPGNKKSKVECYSLRDKIIRNVIIGGMIQTDYSEIRVRRDARSYWLSDRSDEKLLITLGIVFTQTLVELLGKDRQDVDFAITPNGHICVFDTNPGGSGYSNQLVNMSTMESVIKASGRVLNSITTKDELIDRYTKRYYEKIDVDAAKEWIKDALATFESLPDDVVGAFPSAQRAVFEDILSGFSVPSPGQANCVFVNDEWSKWIYQDNSVSPSLTWKARVHELRTRGMQRKRVCLVSSSSFIPRPIVSILGQVSDWADVVSTRPFMHNGLYPLATVNGRFYFTNQPETTSLDSAWCRGNVYCVDQSLMPPFSTVPVSLAPVPRSLKFTLDLSDPLKIGSASLAPIVTSKMPSLLNEFLDHCAKNHSDKLEITSMDEHLKSAMGIVTTLQFAEWFIAKINKPYSITFLLEEYNDYASHDIVKNIENHRKRNEFLEGMTTDWVDYVNSKYRVQGSFRPSSDIKCGLKGTLPHWREFKLKCGNKALILYPNGGLINEWHFDRYNDTVGLTIDNISHLDDIPLYRKSVIMYDAEIKDC